MRPGWPSRKTQTASNVSFTSRVWVPIPIHGFSTRGQSLYMPHGSPLTEIPLRRSKGKTELALAELAYSDTVVLRPAALGEADRPERRLTEACFMCVVPFPEAGL